MWQVPPAPLGPRPASPPTYITCCPSPPHFTQCNPPYARCQACSCVMKMVQKVCSSCEAKYSSNSHTKQQTKFAKQSLTRSGLMATKGQVDAFLVHAHDKVGCPSSQINANSPQLGYFATVGQVYRQFITINSSALVACSWPGSRTPCVPRASSALSMRTAHFAPGWLCQVCWLRAGVVPSPFVLIDISARRHLVVR